MNILLAAEGSAGVQTLKLLHRTKHKLSGVMSSGKREFGISVAKTASELGYPVYDAKFVKQPEFSDWVRKNNIDILINVNSLYVIHPEILDAIQIGAFNLHPGPLPKYAGLNAPSWAIFNDEEEHAVTLHWISPGIDTGHIAYANTFPIKKTDTGLTLNARCVHYGLPLIQQLLQVAAYDPSFIPQKPQNLLKRRYFRKSDVPGNGYLNWNKTAEDIDAFVRACDYFPFPSAWGYPKTSNGTAEIAIAKTSVSRNLCISAPGTVCYFEEKAAVATKGSWLIIDRCYANGKYTSPQELLKNGQKLGGYWTNS